MPPHSPEPAELCEAALHKDIQQNQEAKIWPRHVLIAQRFLSRRLELLDLYVELVEKVGPDLPRLWAFFDCVFDAAHVWSPENLVEARGHRIALGQVNERIALLAEELADLLDQRTELNNAGRFRSETMYHICDLIEEAGKPNPSFELNLQPRLEALRHQYDLKYWPDVADLVRALARDSCNAEIKPGDALTAAGTESLRPSRTDFFRVLFEAFHEYSRGSGPLPAGFSLSDKVLATVMNCALDLPADELADAEYVKGVRKRMRDHRRD